MTKSRSMSPPPPYATVQDYNQNSTATGTNTMPSSAIIPLPLSEEDSFDCLFDNYFSLNDNLCLPNGDDVKHETLSLSPVSLPKQPENYNLPPLSSVSLPNRQYNYNYLPSGYKFRPKDEELILYYLMKKLSNQSLPCNIVIDVDLYKFNPWDLLAEKQSTGEKQEIYLFTPRDRKYPNGNLPSRRAGDGFWKATGADKKIKRTVRKPYKDKVYGEISYGDVIGTKRALVFYQGNPPKGVKTNWIMHEYNLYNQDRNVNKKGTRNHMRLDDWVLCRIYLKDKHLKGTLTSSHFNHSSDLDMDEPASTDHENYMHHHHQPPDHHQVSHVPPYNSAHMFPYDHQQNFNSDHQAPSCLPQYPSSYQSNDQ
ncbi:hypothetical protein ACOSQ2_031822 [Xanthoceras sorbifolium]